MVFFINNTFLRCLPQEWIKLIQYFSKYILYGTHPKSLETFDFPIIGQGNGRKKNWKKYGNVLHSIFTLFSKFEKISSKNDIFFSDFPETPLTRALWHGHGTCKKFFDEPNSFLLLSWKF